ncbi:hypothetical protein [Lacticaseibacillus paracasei]|uniref:hypothetical protein n=1 Tax=Lacticaseibacillus paracasei TaxID=1597 RepID=UPI0031F6BDBB
MKALICLILNALSYAGIALLLDYQYISDGPVLIYFLLQLSISLSICLIMREETKKMWRILFFSQFLSLLLNLLTLYAGNLPFSTYFKPFTVYGWPVLTQVFGLLLQAITAGLFIWVKRVIKDKN